MTATTPDLHLFETNDDELLSDIRSLGHGGGIDERQRSLLIRCGLAEKEGGLSPAGTALYQLAWVRRQTAEAVASLGQAVRVLLPVQVIEQELRGFGTVPEDGVLDLLRLHRAAPADLTVDRLRWTVRWLNKAGVLVYSQKHKTVRALTPPDDATVVGENRRLAAMVSPRTPFSNVVRLRRILRSLHGIVYWADPHFGARALEELIEALDLDRVSEVRILSGDDASVLSDRSWRDFGRFQTEMAGKGTSVEWRVDAKRSRDWHDRWVVDNAGAFNVPPINTLFKGDWSELLPTDIRPPVADWWHRATVRTS